MVEQSNNTNSGVKEKISYSSPDLAKHSLPQLNKDHLRREIMKNPNANFFSGNLPRTGLTNYTQGSEKLVIPTGSIITL
jgi:hypothetical protein